MEFKCVTRDPAGKVATNVVRARDIAAVVSHLKKGGYLPIKVEEVKVSRKYARSFAAMSGHKVKMKELIVFTRQLAATLSAGLVLVEALDTVSDEMENKYFQSVIVNVIMDIQGGMDFSTALSKYPNIFSVGYVSLVKSGEATGRLYKSMSDLAQYLENTQRVREKVKSALSYPAFVFCFALVVIGVVVVFLIPKFQDIFVQVGADLPLLTKMVIGASSATLKMWPLFIIGIITLVFSFKHFLKVRRFRHLFDRAILHVPVIGKEVIHKSMMSRFCHTLGALLSGGVSLSTSLDITSRVVDHIPIGNAIGHIRDRVVAGANLSDEIKMQPLFPSIVSKMVAVGERTRTISEMLKRTADYYDDELDNTLQKLTSLIEPVLIVVIGGFICLIIIALYLPIFKVTALVI